MTAVWELVKLFWKPLAIIAAALLVLWAANHYIHRYGNARYAEGQQNIKDQDAKATKELREKVAQLTAEKQALADAAKAKHDDEHLTNLIAAAQPVGVSQLCKPATDHRSVGVREAGGAHPGDEAAPAASAVVQPLPEADNGFTDDRRALLGALAALSDDQTAVIREYQAR